MSGSENLVRMANDIGNYFRAQPNREDAIAGIANHIKSFWTKRMRGKLFDQLDHGEAGLDDLPREAVQRLRDSEPKPTADLKTGPKAEPKA
jgi:formate dehydrogenase subunit delta